MEASIFGSTAAMALSDSTALSRTMASSEGAINKGKDQIIEKLR
jgi:hypothetical protein